MLGAQNWLVLRFIQNAATYFFGVRKVISHFALSKYATSQGVNIRRSLYLRALITHTWLAGPQGTQILRRLQSNDENQWLVFITVVTIRLLYFCETALHIYEHEHRMDTKQIMPFPKHNLLWKIIMCGDIGIKPVIFRPFKKTLRTLKNLEIKGIKTLIAKWTT